MTLNLLTYLDEVFGPEGLLAASKPGYLPRPEQIELASRIAISLLTSADVFVAEAPCGTGKTYAYLVPAIFHMLETGQPVVISTAGIGLQSQLFEKDVPAVQDLFRDAGYDTDPDPFTYALLKGVGNYVCKKKTEQLPIFPATPPDLKAWLDTTLTGDREEAPPHTDDHWQVLSTSSDECPGSRCAQASKCHALRARANAAMADVIITNHHLLSTLGAIDDGENALITSNKNKRRRLLVLDEAHEYPAIAQNMQSVRLNRNWLASRLTAFEDRPDLLARKQVGLDLLSQLFSDKTTRLASDAERSLLSDTLTLYVSVYNQLQAAIESSGSSQTRDIFKQQNDAFYQKITTAAALLRKIDGVHISNEKGGEVLHGISTKVKLPTSPVIAVSATIQHSGSYKNWLDSVSVPESKITLSPSVRSFTARSPFRWDWQCMVVIPHNARDPSADRDAYPGWVASQAVEAVKAARGRTLVLCTSWTNVKAVAEALTQHAPYTLLVQGQRSKQELIEAFSSDINSVLVGTSSFWTGVDVPGEALSALVIDKLPFAVVDTPLSLIQKLQHGPRMFSDVVLPETVRMFAQGFGRLIRSVTDRGAVVVLDRRISTKPYGSAFFSVLPDEASWTDKIADIGPFLDKTRPLSMTPEDDA